MSTPPKTVTLAQSDALNAIPPMRLDPQALIAKAIEAGATVETLERLVNLAKDIRATSAREAYFESMAIFKRTCPRIKKDATANAGTYAYKYATLDGILDIVDPLLGQVGLTVSWHQKHEQNAVHASCIITHRLGHQEQSGFIAIPFETAGRMNPAQRVGSAATYAKRYSLLAVLGLAPEDDDDAGGAGERTVSAEPAEPGSLFLTPEEQERTALIQQLEKVPPGKIKVALHRLLSLDPETDWRSLDMAALATLAKHVRFARPFDPK